MRNPVGTSPAFPTAKLRALFAVSKSLQGLQGFGNKEDKCIRKRIEKSKSLQTLQRFAEAFGTPYLCKKVV